MAIVGLDHVQLAMPEGGEPEARSFYEGLLGIPEVDKPPPLAARGGCWFESEHVKVHLGVETSFQPARKAHPALLVSDLTSLADALRAAGVDVRMDDRLPSVDRGYVNDPFGNRLELIGSPSPAP